MSTSELEMPFRLLRRGYSFCGTAWREFGGLLSLLCTDESDPVDKFCSIWIMKEYGVVDSWYKYARVDLTGGIASKGKRLKKRKLPDRYLLLDCPNFITSHLNQSLTSPKNSYHNLPLVTVRQCIAPTSPIRFGPPQEQIRLEHYKLFIDTGEEEDNTFDEYLEIPFPLYSRYCYVLQGYVKGLFCFELSEILLWNPSIRRSISLPKPGITENTHGLFSDYLGFGFDSQSNDYKVVRVVILCGGTRSEEVPLVEVYSLNSGLWKESSGAGNSFPRGSGLLYLECPAAC
ncbi:hypothetical protein C3L33_21739, partial [Rhododendron williamsianum]